MDASIPGEWRRLTVQSSQGWEVAEGGGGGAGGDCEANESRS